MHLHVEMRSMAPEHLVELIDQAPVGICVVAAPSLRVVAANGEYAALVGSARPDLLLGTEPGASGDSLVESLLPLWQCVLRTGRAAPRTEITHDCPLGPCTLDARCTPLCHADGSVCAVMTTLLDVSERKRSEEEAGRARRQAEEAYRREHRIAVSFQRSLLPDGATRVPGFAVAHDYRPALLEADVGGDFYNLFPIDAQHTGIVVGDVGGKGLDAAVIAARVQHSITALAVHHPRDPAAIIQDVQRIAAAPEEVDRIVTLFLGILEHGTGRLTYASAGHEPAFVWRARERRTESLLPSGPAICSVDLEPAASQETGLMPGDLLFIYTDGLPDARSGGESLGWDRVAEMVARHHAEGPAALVEAAYDAALAYGGGRLRDDIALVALQRLAPPTWGVQE